MSIKSEEKEQKYVQLSLDDLKSLLEAKKGSDESSLTRVLETIAAGQKAMADALLESRKPYIDPKKEYNENLMREQMREVMVRQKRDMEYAQENCEHHMGCNPLSSQPSQTSSFIKHTLDTGEVIGICTVCTKVLSSLNPTDRKLLSASSNNKQSTAGVRHFNNPVKAMTARLGPVRQKEILDSMTDGASL
jgi:hypothetical protein